MSRQDEEIASDEERGNKNDLQASVAKSRNIVRDEEEEQHVEVAYNSEQIQNEEEEY